MKTKDTEALGRQRAKPSKIKARGAPDPDPDPDPARYPVNFVDPVRIRPDPETVDPVEIRIRPDPECRDPTRIRIQPDPT